MSRIGRKPIDSTRRRKDTAVGVTVAVQGPKG